MEITQPIRVRFALSSNPFCLGHLGQKPKKSSNTACLAQDVEGESPGLLHEQQEVVHYPSIVGLRGHPDMTSTLHTKVEWESRSTSNLQTYSKVWIGWMPPRKWNNGPHWPVQPVWPVIPFPV